MMKDLGLKHFRFSLAWGRILPGGTLASGVSKEGVAFYNKVIDALLKAGIEPAVTIYHWDLPQALSNDKIGGWLDEAIVGHFVDYAEVCFKEFGDRVKFWVTFNEPHTFTTQGYGTGEMAPGNQSNSGNFANVATGQYIAGHNLLMAHAKTVQLYRQKFQPFFGGKIGITNNCDWREPIDFQPENIAACNRALEF